MLSTTPVGEEVVLRPASLDRSGTEVHSLEHRANLDLAPPRRTTGARAIRPPLPSNSPPTGQYHATSSFVSANGPSMTIRSPPVTLTRLRLELAGRLSP